MLPRDFPTFNTVFYYFNKWKLEGAFKELLDTLHVIVGRMSGREDTPSLGIIDSRSIKSSHHVTPDRGIDGNKKIKGRKEHIVVDTLGLPMGVVVHEADIHDSVGAHSVIDAMQGCFPRMKKILADGGYKGQKLIDTVKQKLGAEFTVVLRPDESSKKFNVFPLRWIVGRSLSWLESFRRIAMDYEFYSDTGEAMVHLAKYPHLKQIFQKTVCDFILIRQLSFGDSTPFRPFGNTKQFPILGNGSPGDGKTFLCQEV